MYDIDNLSCIIRAETLHIANDDQRIQTGKEREREEGRERKSEREKRERKKTRTSRLAHGGLIRSSLLTLLPAARLLCTDGERERARARTREKERDRERERESNDDLYGHPVVRVLQRNARNLPLFPHSAALTLTL